jgi:Tfp pilus assembly protein PilW
MIELMVAVVRTSIRGTIAMGAALGAPKVSTNAQSNSDLMGDTRAATERLVRELRQAGTIDDIHLPTSPSDQTSITFWADFNNNGVRDLNAADPEVLTYRFTPSTGALTLTVDDADGQAVTTPILASGVIAFGLGLRSSEWQYDRNGDGVVDWSEIDATPSPVGNQNGRPDGPELARLDSVVLTLTVRSGSRTQTYRTTVDFRNRHQV